MTGISESIASNDLIFMMYPLQQASRDNDRDNGVALLCVNATTEQRHPRTSNPVVRRGGGLLAHAGQDERFTRLQADGLLKTRDLLKRQLNAGLTCTGARRKRVQPKKVRKR